MIYVLSDELSISGAYFTEQPILVNTGTPEKGTGGEVSRKIKKGSNAGSRLT